MDKGVKSPCTGKCRMDADNICPLCFRTLEEISVWAYADNRARRKILAKAGFRKRFRGEGRTE